MCSQFECLKKWLKHINMRIMASSPFYSHWFETFNYRINYYMCRNRKPQKMICHPDLDDHFAYSHNKKFQQSPLIPG